MRYVHGMIRITSFVAPMIAGAGAGSSAELVADQAQPPAAVVPAGPQAPPVPPPLPAPLPPAPAKPVLVPPPLPPEPPPVSFFVEQNGQAVGPMTLDQVKGEIDAHRVDQQTLVWKSGDPPWVAANQVAELKPLFASLPPSIPPESQWRQYLVGTWRTQIVATNSGQQFTELIMTRFRADGTFAGVLTMSVNGMNGSTQPFSGTWTVQAVDDNTLSP